MLRTSATEDEQWVHKRNFIIFVADPFLDITARPQPSADHQEFCTSYENVMADLLRKIW